MKTCHLTLLSKNKTSLDNSFSLIFNYINSNNNILKKYSPQKTKKYFLSILKSPHVNKKAQEQFEFMVYSKQITINYYKTPELLFILKKLKDNLFSDVKLKIRLSLTKNDNNRSKIFYLNNFKLNINSNLISQTNNLKRIKRIKNFKTSNNNKIKQLLKIIDLNGELKNYFTI